MELYDEENEQKKSKVPVIIISAIVILTIITGLIILAMIYLKNSITIIQIDSVRNLEIEKILYIESTEDGLELYMPIIKTAKFLEYEGFVGDYKDKSEDKTKCHVTCKDETAMFSKDSDVLIKIIDNKENEYITLDKPVFEKDGELYTTIEGIQKAFNVLFSTDKKMKNIEIYTMNYLVGQNANNLKIEKYSNEFCDKKAIFEGMLIIEENGRFGVKDVVAKKYVLEPKYEEIKYLPITKEFLIKSNGKYGVMTKEQSVIIKPTYDQIIEMDNKKGLYLVKQNNAYGVLNTKGKVIIEPEHQKIGIDISRYYQNGVDNQYILLDEIIPIKNSQNLWALFNINGEKLTNFIYTDIGCTTLPVSNSYPTVVIPSYKVIVVNRDKKYNLVTLDGKELISKNILDSVYIKIDTTTGQNKFFMTSNNNEKVINVEEWLAKTGR